MAENFPNLEKETHIQIQETPRYQKNKKNKPKRPTPRHIIIKMSKVKDKERILKTARVKQLVRYSGTLITQQADFSGENLQARKG